MEVEGGEGGGGSTTTLFLRAARKKKKKKKSPCRINGEFFQVNHILLWRDEGGQASRDVPSPVLTSPSAHLWLPVWSQTKKEKTEQGLPAAR